MTINIDFVYKSKQIIIITPLFIKINNNNKLRKHLFCVWTFAFSDWHWAMLFPHCSLAPRCCCWFRSWGMRMVNSHHLKGGLYLCCMCPCMVSKCGQGRGRPPSKGVFNREQMEKCETFATAPWKSETGVKGCEAHLPTASLWWGGH